MKKKLLCILAVLAALVMIATMVGPGVILNAVRQPEPEDGFAYAESFRTDYEASGSICRSCPTIWVRSLPATPSTNATACTSIRSTCPAGAHRPIWWF